MRAQSFFLSLFLTFCLSPLAAAHEFTYSALLSGPAESPPNASPGFGMAVVTLDLDLITMRVEVSFSNLTGTATAAHIHGVTAAPGTGTAIVLTQLPSLPGFPLGVTSGTYDETIDLTVASSYNPAFITASGGTVSDALNALIFGMADGKTYFNIHTDTFPGGEISGFLLPVAVPEPGTVALCSVAGMAVVGGVWYRRRRANRFGRVA